MQKKFKQMSSRELSLFLEQGGALVDIRREEEWRLTGVVAGSLLLTFFAADGSSQPTRWLEQLNREVPLEQPLAVICRTGYRTTFICDFLITSTPRQEVYNLTDGIFGWLAEDLPVSKVEGAA